MIGKKYVLVFCTILSTYSVSRAQERYYCRNTNMPLSWTSVGHPVEIRASQVVFTDLGTIEPSIDVRNTTKQKIASLVFVIEYLNKESKTVATAVIAGAAPGMQKGISTPFPIENVEPWKGLLVPDGVARVQGISDGNRTVTCPTSGQITFAQVKFQNGITQRYASPGWQVPPLPTVVPRLDLPCPETERGIIQIPAKLKVSADGRVIGVSADSLVHSDLVSWAATQLQRWKFHPALLNGMPKESELAVQLIFNLDTEQALARISLSSPAVIIRFVPFIPTTVGPPAESSSCFEAFASLNGG